MRHQVRTVFFGTPELAVPALEALVESSTVLGVVCQPDRPAGRGLALSEPAVKHAAQRLGLDVYQPVKVRSGELEQWLAERDVDVAVVMAYGRILPAPVLAAPRRGCINLHASVLPRYRGAAPINWAIIRGESETGVSLMQMDEGLDTGPVYAVRKLPIGPEETAGELSERIAGLAAVMVREDLPRAVSGELPAVPQDHRYATLAPPLTKEDTRLDFSRPAREVVDRVRGISPRPGAHTTLRGKKLKVLVARAAGGTSEPVLPPGTVSTAGPEGIQVAAADGSVTVLRAQLEGKRSLDARDLVNGRILRVGDVLGS